MGFLKGHQQIPNHHVSRGHFPILSRHPSFRKTIRTPGETAGFWKERWLKRMGNQPLDCWGVTHSSDTNGTNPTTRSDLRRAFTFALASRLRQKDTLPGPKKDLLAVSERNLINFDLGVFLCRSCFLIEGKQKEKGVHSNKRPPAFGSENWVSSFEASLFRRVLQGLPKLIPPPQKKKHETHLVATR